MLQDWDKRFPGRVETIFRSIQHVAPSHLADTTLYDFDALIGASNETSTVDGSLGATPRIDLVNLE